jgi:mRNA deadenylase 3'-5' endonuclease subunit Ccr4
VPFTVVSYNVLATAYIRRRFYPHTPPDCLAPSWRVPALVRHVAALDADLLCLQEVEAEVFAAMKESLGPLGYEGRYAPKEGGRPDGCASFWRRRRFALQHEERLVYDDGSGHVALLLGFAAEGRMLGLANTHLKWDAPDLAPQLRHGLREARQLLGAIAGSAAVEAWILCGDFNATPEDAVPAAIGSAGFRAAHDALRSSFTCNSNGEAKVIDYLVHSAALRATPQPPPAIDGATPLPSATQPSDHLALQAVFDWRR